MQNNNSRTILIMAVDDGIERLIPMNTVENQRNILNWLEVNFGKEQETKRTAWAKQKCIKDLFSGKLMVDELKRFYKVYKVEEIFIWDETYQAWQVKNLLKLLNDNGIEID